MGKDRWQQLLETVAHSDELPVRDCGEWTERKLWFWNRYIEITTNAMVGKPQWRGGLVYLDLYAGPGICKIKGTGRRLPGSPLIAANAPKPFERLILAELDPKNVDACRHRVCRFCESTRVRMIEGDCNANLEKILAEIPDGALTLTFVDPEDFGIRFSTLERLAKGRRMDFFILFADAIDLVRNVDMYERLSESKLYEAMPPRELWLDDWRRLENRDGPHVRRFFAEKFACGLRECLGYKGVREEVIEGPKGPLYRLIYASKSEKGLEFWDKIAKKELGGQHRFW